MSEKEAFLPLVIGDSIAEGLRVIGRYNNAAKSELCEKGRTPQEVLETIRRNAVELVGRDVVLSTGASNDPQADICKSVQQQVEVLRASEVKRIIIVGVGDREDFQESKLNEKLRQAATEVGVIFSGPLDPQNLRRGKQRWDQGVHLNGFGNKALCETIKAILT